MVLYLTNFWMYLKNFKNLSQLTKRRQTNYIQTHTHTEKQTQICIHRHTDKQTETNRHADTQTHRETDTQTHRHTDTQSYRHTHTYRHVDTHIATHTYTYTVLSTFRMNHRKISKKYTKISLVAALPGAAIPDMTKVVCLFVISYVISISFQVSEPPQMSEDEFPTLAAAAKSLESKAR